MITRFRHIAQALGNAVKRQAYRRFATSGGIDEAAVLLDQQHGLSLDGNLHYIAHELADTDRYGDLTVRFAVDKRNRRHLEALLETRGVPVAPVTRSSLRYYRALATSKYLVTDTSFPLAFAKREGQVLWNTWHGTPLKTLGRSEGHEAHLIGNVQKNFAQADYLSHPNGYTAAHIDDDYMLDGLCRAIRLLAEYPRNEPFASPASPARRKRFIPADVKAYAYLPTFRFSAASNAKTASIDVIARHLADIDKRLDDRETLFVKLHPAIGSHIPLDAFQHVEPVPDTLELYEFLNLCDVLVTDYSSVMLDFAITRKKVVLFAFDQDRYLADRGLYRPLDSLPFPLVTDVQGLVRELRAPKAYDDAGLLAEMSPYDAWQTTERLCRRVFNDETGIVDEREEGDATGAPTLVLTNRLPDDDELESFNAELLAMAGTSRVYLAFPCSTAAGRVEFLAKLSAEIGFIPYAGRMAVSPLEAIALAARRAHLLGDEACTRIVSDAIAFEARRIFGNASFGKVVCRSDDWKSAQLACHVKTG